MYLLTLKDRKDDGAYAVQNRYGDKVLFLFEEEDDAVRYALQLEDQEDAEMEVVEVDETENTITILNRYIDEAEFNCDKTIIKGLLQKIYSQACEVE